MTWEPFELVVVRSAGFPFTWLDGLRDAELVRLVDEVRRLARTVDEAAETFLARAAAAGRPDDQVSFRRARDLVRAVRSRRVVPVADAGWVEEALDLPGWSAAYNQALRGRDNAADALEGHYGTALSEARMKLASLLSIARLREALFLLTPEILDHGVRRFLERPPTSSAPNQDERKLVSYVQRLCAKAETNAFAGPIAYAWIGPEPPGYLASLPEHERRGFAAFWAVRALVGGLHEGWPSASPRRGPAADLVDLPPGLRRLVDAMDGRTTWRELAASMEGRLPPRAVVEWLDRRGVAWTTPQLVASEPDALAVARAMDLPEEQAERVTRLQRLADHFALADLTGKAQALRDAEQLVREAGIEEVRRGAGRLYADRTVLYEEDLDGRRGGALPPAALARVCEALGPVLDLAASAAADARDEAAERTRAAMREHFPGTGKVTLAAFLRAVPFSHHADVSTSPTARRLAEAVVEAWDGTNTEVVLDAAHLAELCPPPDGPLLASPDVLLSANSRGAVERGEFDVVVGEVHWGLQLLGNLCCFVTDRDALLNRARHWLAPLGGEGLLNVALSDRYGKMAFLEVFGSTLELSGPAAGLDVMHPGDLEVDEQARLWTRAGGHPVQLMMGDPVGAEHTAFAPPALRLPQLQLGPFTPRVRLGTAVIQRATWVLDASDLDEAAGRKGAARYHAVVEALRGRGMPERLFARLPGEGKPVYLDLASPHLVDLLVKSGREGKIRLSEMLPNHEGLWLSDGGPHCCELRLAFGRLSASEQRGAWLP